MKFLCHICSLRRCLLLFRLYFPRIYHEYFFLVFKFPFLSMIQLLNFFSLFNVMMNVFAVCFISCLPTAVKYNFSVCLILTFLIFKGFLFNVPVRQTFFFHIECFSSILPVVRFAFF